MLALSLAGISYIVILNRNINLLVPLISITVTLAFCEFTLAYWLRNDNNLYFEDGTGYKQNYGLKLIGNKYQGEPGKYPFKRLDQNGNIIYDVVYSINTDGFRKDVPESTTQIYIYGGSFVFGEGLNDNETLTHYLFAEHNLLAKNVGFHGWGMHNALFNIQSGQGNLTGGVNVLLTSPWHALRSACKQKWTAYHPKYTLVNGRISQTGICTRLSNRYLRLPLKVLARSNIYGLFRKYFVDLKITNSDIELWLAIIKEIQKISGERGSKLLIAYIDATEDQLSYSDWTNEKIINSLKSLSDIFVDITLAEKREFLEPKFFIHELDQHPSALANKRRAQLLAPIVRRLKN